MRTLEIEIPKPGQKRYGITEKKKAELDLLNSQVVDAQYDVEQLQAVVTALTEKFDKFQAALAAAEAEKLHTLSNRNLVDQAVENVTGLMNNSGVTFNEMVIADAKTKQMAIDIKNLIDKLIFSAEVINKLSNIVIRTKRVNPLISDELVSRIGAVGKDANNAVALALVALQSTFVAQASNLESEAATALEYTQAIMLYEVLSGNKMDGDAGDNKNTCLKQLLYEAYSKADKNYTKSHKASLETIKQLNSASANLTQAQIKLRSLQSGLAAANAAVLAS